MAHNLFQNKMAFVDDVPWHGLGTRVAADISANEMCRAAGLDWQVWKDPAPGAKLRKSDPEIFDRYLILREAVGNETEDAALGMVGPNYEVLQNDEAFQFFEPLIHSGYAEFHTAGALGNGERVWVLVKLKENIVVTKNDEIERYVLLSNNHSGSGAVSVRFTPIRVVCQNTLNLAFKDNAATISIRHTKFVARNLIDSAADELKGKIEATFAHAQRQFSKMAATSVKLDESLLILEKIFPRTAIQIKRKEVPERWQLIEKILDDREISPENTRDTVWGLYNAITRYEDYRLTRESAAEARLDRIWFGSGQDLKLRALSVCCDFLGGRI
jgi:phage/plasmid-like protein (TIGR03299 family)